MNVAGRWNVTMPTPIGTLKFVWDLDESAGAWRGAMSGEPPVGNSELRDIKVTGDAISFATTVNSPMGSLPVTFSGTCTGDTLQGICKTRFGDNKFNASRA